MFQDRYTAVSTTELIYSVREKIHIVLEHLQAGIDSSLRISYPFVGNFTYCQVRAQTQYPSISKFNQIFHASILPLGDSIHLLCQWESARWFYANPPWESFCMLVYPAPDLYFPTVHARERLLVVHIPAFNQSQMLVHTSPVAPIVWRVSERQYMSSRYLWYWGNFSC